MNIAKTIEEKKITPVKLECDVLVAGGGTSGVVAALAAARNGAATVLVERYGNLGGTMINGAGPLHGFFNTWNAFPGYLGTLLTKLTNFSISPSDYKGSL